VYVRVEIRLILTHKVLRFLLPNLSPLLIFHLTLHRHLTQSLSIKHEFVYKWRMYSSPLYHYSRCLSSCPCTRSFDALEYVTFRSGILFTRGQQVQKKDILYTFAMSVRLIYVGSINHFPKKEYCDYVKH
jgi:hypothetical protein